MKSPSESADSPGSIISKGEVTYPARVCKILQENKQIRIKITGASKSVESHSKLPLFIVYTIQLGPLIVKRRYSEFESLRICLVKCYPTILIPPIPEKQSIASNITQTTSSSLSVFYKAGVKGATSQLSHLEGNSVASQVSADEPNDSAIDSNDIDPNSMPENGNLVEYRIRMLAIFLNRCLDIEQIRHSRFFCNFLDPETNFHDFLGMNENAALYKASLYQLSPFEALDNISNQLYLTLPIPSSSDAHKFVDLARSDQFQKLVKFEDRFQKYQSCLDKISKSNKRMMKSVELIAPEMADIGSLYKDLSVVEDSDFVEDVAKLYEREVIFLESLSRSVRYVFLDRIVELKHFAKAVKELTEYNRKKIIQCKIVESELNKVRRKYKTYESLEVRNQEIEKSAKKAMGKHGLDNSILDEPFCDSELQTALSSQKQGGIYGKIPVLNRLSNVLQKYTDANPEQTHRNKLYNMKLRLYQLQRQHEIVETEIGHINRDVIKQLVGFHNWFRVEMAKLIRSYQNSAKEFVTSGSDAWKEVI